MAKIIKKEYKNVLLIIQKNYNIFMASSEKSGKDNSGNYIYLKDKDGNLGAAGQVLSSTGTELDWITVSGSGASTFLNLTDTPSSFVAERWLKVNAAGTALEWTTAPTTGGTITTDDTAPSNPTDGTLWWDSEKGILNIYYQDADSSQWVNASGRASDGGGGIPAFESKWRIPLGI